ncbi:arylsulfatase B-like [Vanessa tameamea]|uniref:Arylsulfatase B-like n=1 Tax=Vanessa tameamea TaxID=334116 RepID=A0A8B8IKD3_VANTA|nr:arylsulfatase B-like [Vanessa tameamea]
MIKARELIWLRWLPFLCVLCGSVYSSKRPNILFIMVDDMGWNDVSYHGSDQIITPNLDTLATQSVILQQYYSEAICTPARTALLTGKYPMRLGMHGMPLYNSEDRGIPITEQLFPEYLKKLGYSTHLVGKWHLGMSRRQFLPLSRGYDSHYGTRGGFVDYYTHHKVEGWPNGRQFFGLDFFDDDIPQNEEDRYIVDALTDRAIKIIQNHNESRPLFLHLAHTAPHAGNEGGLLQPPLFSTVRNRHIAHSDRRLYAEMVTHLDTHIGKVVRALANKGILEDTIIVFVSDNGAPTVGQFNNWGVNLPFRGKKQTPWEGAVRVPAFIWHSSFKPKVWDGLMHITDWMPTLLAAAGGEIGTGIDGVNQWNSICGDGESKRNDVLIAIEDSATNVYAAYRAGDYKIIVGNVSGLSNGYYGSDLLRLKESPPDYFPSLRSSDVAKVFEKLGLQLDYDQVLAMRKASVIRQLDGVRDLIPCEPTPTRGCLYNVRQDPSESHNLWSRGTKIAALLTSRLRALWSMQQRRGPLALDARSDPANFDYTWVPWLNDTMPGDTNNTNSGTNITANNIDAGILENTYLVNKSDLDTRTVASVVGCDRATGFRNLLCLIKTVI